MLESGMRTLSPYDRLGLQEFTLGGLNSPHQASIADPSSVALHVHSLDARSPNALLTCARACTLIHTPALPGDDDLPPFWSVLLIITDEKRLSDPSRQISLNIYVCSDKTDCLCIASPATAR